MKFVFRSLVVIFLFLFLQNGSASSQTEPFKGVAPQLFGKQSGYIEEGEEEVCAPDKSWCLGASGHLWRRQGGFRGVGISDGPYTLTCEHIWGHIWGQVSHLGSGLEKSVFQRAGHDLTNRGIVAESADQYDWSSHRAYLRTEAIPWLSTGPVKWAHCPDRFLRNLSYPSPTGSSTTRKSLSWEGKAIAEKKNKKKIDN